MDFSIPEEIQQLRQTLRDFVDRAVIPLEPSIEAEDRIPDSLLRQMREMGLFGITIPQRFGGLGIGPLGYALISEEVGRAHGAVRTLIGISNGIGSKILVSFGTSAQQDTYLPRMASGELATALAVSEPGAGSDVGAIRTSAERQGDAYVLNGTKHFITNAAHARLLTVLARTSKEHGTRSGMSMFLVTPDLPGFRLGRRHETMAGRGCGRAEVVLEDCRVPAANRIGEEGRGFQMTMSCLQEGRVAYAAMCLGLAQRLLEMSADYARQRVQFGRPIAEFQAIQFMLADMASSIYAARMATYHAAWKCERNEECAQEASMAKLLASEAAGKVADSAVQIHGAMGYARDYAVERMYREARVFRIAEGTSEIQRGIIARKVLE
ncbi:MAG: acyl-CoA dehydrogenase [Gammaproteobacteria bacterium]|nr:acyl-CoA dehydrogenase [Gammaproteobacteria bacterium]